MAKPSDAAQTAAPSWVDRYPPARLRPYLKLWRADKPIGGWLWLWPCRWSLASQEGQFFRPQPSDLFLQRKGSLPLATLHRMNRQSIEQRCEQFSGTCRVGLHTNCVAIYRLSIVKFTSPFVQLAE